MKKTIGIFIFSIISILPAFAERQKEISIVQDQAAVCRKKLDLEIESVLQKQATASERRAKRNTNKVESPFLEDTLDLQHKSDGDFLTIRFFRSSREVYDTGRRDGAGDQIFRVNICSTLLATFKPILLPSLIFTQEVIPASTIYDINGSAVTSEIKTIAVNRKVENISREEEFRPTNITGTDAAWTFNLKSYSECLESI